MASAGSIFVSMLLDDTKYTDGLKRSSRNTSDWASKTKKEFSGSIVAVDSISGALTRLAGVAAASLSVQKILEYSDTYKGLQSRLSLVTNSSQELADVTDKLFKIAQSNSQPLEATIDAYTRLNQSLNESQKSQTDLIKFTDLLSKTLLISGTNAAGAATFFQQFGQAASSDFKAVGQELQTFADQNPRFYRILRDEATKYGKTLKQMATDGELSFDFIAKATLNASDSIEADAGRISGTVGKSFTELNNTFLLIVGNSDLVKSSTTLLAEAISALSDNLADAERNGFSYKNIFDGINLSFLEFIQNIERYKLTIAEKINFFGFGDDAVKRQKEILDGINATIQAYEYEAIAARKVPGAKEADIKNKTVLSTPPVIDSKAQKEAEKREKELQTLYEKNEALILGVSDANLKYQRTVDDLDKLLKNGKISIEEYNTAVAGSYAEFQKASDKANIWAFDVDAATKRAAENIQDNLADFLFDPFEHGLKGMLKGFVDVLRKMAAEAASAQLLKGLFGDSGGIFSKLVGSLVGGFTGGGLDAGADAAVGAFTDPFAGYFADGGFIPPGQFGIAGENEAELVYGGRSGATITPPGKMGGGGNTYIIDARGADQGALARIQQALLGLAGPGVIEQRVLSAQQRGAL